MNLFELSAKISLDSKDYEKGINDASNKTSKFSEKVGTGLKAAAKIGTAAITAAATGIVALTKSSIEQYAEYEQLVGGVETLFKKSADVVQGYAENAYKTAGMSANEYMNTVTSFSASLIQSLGGDTEKAAEVGNMTITDMSDNANKMGTSMEMIQNAYQGFAKGNMTMLDNLKLGYGGTQQEMQRLLKDAEKLSGQKYDISSFADIAEAIHVVQTEMGITGTTAKEAADTIEGSLAMTKGAWQNLVTGMADDEADFQGLVDNFVESVATAGENLIPRIEMAVSGIGTLIESLAPIIAESLPTMIEAVLPSLLNAGISLLGGIMQGIVMALPALADSALQIISELAISLGESLPTLIPSVVGIIMQIVNTLTDPTNLDNLITAALTIISGLADGIVDALPVILETVPVIIENLVEAISSNINRIITCGVNISLGFIKGILSKIPKIASAAFKIVGSLIDGIGNMASQLIYAGKQVIENVASGIVSMFKDAKTWGKDLIQNFINGIKASIGKLKNAVKNVAQTVRDLIGFSEPKEGPLSNFHTYAPDMMDLFAQGVKNKEPMLKRQVAKSFDFGEQTIAANYVSTYSGNNAMNQQAYGSMPAMMSAEPQKVEISVGIDQNANMIGFARALLPLLKVAEKEAFA